MYKQVIFFVTILTSLSGYTQSDSLSFSVSSYYQNNTLHRTDTVSIKNTKKTLDIHFYKEHFYQFYGLPKKLIKGKFKNQEITVWAFEDRPKEYNENWTNSYTYDAQGRLVEYQYSGCMICSQFPWGFTLVYDDDNNIIEQQTYFLSLTDTIESGEVKTVFELSKQSTGYTKLTYDSEGNIILLEKYGRNDIEKIIKRIK